MKRKTHILRNDTPFSLEEVKEMMDNMGSVTIKYGNSELVIPMIIVEGVRRFYTNDPDAHSILENIMPTLKKRMDRAMDHSKKQVSNKYWNDLTWDIILWHVAQQ